MIQRRGSVSRPRTATARRLLITTLAGVALIAALGGYVTAQRRLPPPEPPPARVLPDPNGWDAINAALAKLGPAPDLLPTLTESQLRAIVAPNRAALGELRAALRLELVVPEQALVESPLARGNCRNGAQFFAAESRLAAFEDRPAEAMGSALDGVELGQRLASSRGSSSLVLSGVRCCEIGGSEASRLVPTLTGAEAEDAGRRLESICGELVDTVDLLEALRRQYLDEFRGAVDQGDLATYFEVGNAPGLDPVRAGVYPSVRMYRRLDAYLADQVREAAKPYPQRSRFEPRDRSGGALFPSPIREVQFPLRGAIVAVEGHRARLRLVRLELALHAHRLRHGAYPAALADLDGVSEDALTDPFADTPFRYSREGPRYLLYSIGPDGVDGGGTPVLAGGNTRADAGDIVAGKLWPPAAR